MLQSSRRNHKLNSQNDMARTVVTPSRAAAKETNVFVLIYLADFLKPIQPNEICSHLSEKASKSRFLNPEKFQNHRNEEEGKEEKRKKQWLHS